jgi:hypothetical protein
VTRTRETLSAGAAIVVLTMFVTWPQCWYLGTRVAVHDDSYFSMWRLAWIAHALATDPRHLFDANIFHPARGVLAFSDATLFEGLLGAPLLWANTSPIVVYNLLLLGGIAASGLAMFVLARHVIGAMAPALVAAAIFTMAPYRIEHFMHLELQWTMWMPLTFWAFHRAIDEGAWRFGVLGGVFLWLQVVSSVYYGVFLAMTTAVFVVLLLASAPRRARAALPGLIGGTLVAVLLTMPYALPYLNNARRLGPRPKDAVAAFSATPLDYFVSPPQNWLWGWTAAAGSGAERNLFPGVLAIALAATAFAYRPRRLVFVYFAIAALSIELSFGLNGRLYSWLFDHVGTLQGFRAPARFAAIACCAIAVLAGFGADVVFRRLSAAGAGAARGAVACMFILLAIEYRNTGMILTDIAYDPPTVYNVYKAVRALGPGAVVELPLPALDKLPGLEVHYAFASIGHWYPLVNGYSGYYPPEYSETVGRMENFPDDRSIARLRNIGVHYLIFHPHLYAADEYASLVKRMAERRELRPYGTFPAEGGNAELFLLEK